MKFYAVAELEITDRAWVPEYVANVTRMVETYGGRYLARTDKVECLEGDRPRPQIVLLVEWPSREAAVAFYESEEYRPFRSARRNGAKNQFFLIAGEDMTGHAQVPV